MLYQAGTSYESNLSWGKSTLRIFLNSFFLSKFMPHIMNHIAKKDCPSSNVCY
ncbi:hypothetical protein VIBNISO65_1340053 [Vibrio nigripulchritudo SO65]|nr:hypothetical protein VIBNIAM115_850042 [Vibrio nigripulchritudo AM115]CCN43468.1 hypothetical protein VIBNIFTn2_550053 [Vibrio nigripulchritudo FTn2]CCN65776.1 hypothetical protein VIBNIPon4_450052 [Vibrio nigripulchritudo POn4]CCN75323.1 hypothetical protein VIBNISO65_1340053 [Vibrio nigripulchritudo SO65]